jgi:hypothetical protein
MEGQGAYNRHSSRQAGRGVLGIPYLEWAAETIMPNADGEPLMMADYGSSQGRNSLLPICAAINTLRRRFGMDRPIWVVHTDLPSNDFNTLFQTLNSDPNSYLRGQSNIFASCTASSFYESVLPPVQVDLGWCASAAHWLSRIPVYIRDHFCPPGISAEVREVYHAQAASDWLKFLALRALELRPTGRLVIVLPALGEDGCFGEEPIIDAANDCLEDMVTDGVLSQSERERMVVPGYCRSRAQLLAPFEETGTFHGLTMEKCDISRIAEDAWRSYLECGDAVRLATDRAKWFRAAFVPTLATALDPSRLPTDRLAFAGALELALIRKLENALVEMPNTTAVMVVARNAETVLSS